MTSFDAWSEAARLVAGHYVRQTRKSATVTAVLNDIEVRAVGGLSFSLLHLTRIGHTEVRAFVPDLAEVTIHVRERKRSPPRGLTRIAIEDEPRAGLAEVEPVTRRVPARFAVQNGSPSFAEEMRVYTSDEDLARLVLSPEVRRTLVNVEEFDSYDFVLDRGEVQARRNALEWDSENFARLGKALPFRMIADGLPELVSLSCPFMLPSAALGTERASDRGSR